MEMLQNSQSDLVRNDIVRKDGKKDTLPDTKEIRQLKAMNEP